MTPIRRGTARRTGLRPVQPPFPLAVVTQNGRTYAVAIVGSRGRSAYVSASGSAVDGPTVIVAAGQISYTRSPVQHVGNQEAS